MLSSCREQYLLEFESSAGTPGEFFNYFSFLLWSERGMIFIAGKRNTVPVYSRYRYGILLCTCTLLVVLLICDNLVPYRTDSDPRICTTYLRIRLFSSVAIQVFFFTFLLDDGRICTNNYQSGSGRPKNRRIRIHNTDFMYFLYLFLWLLPESALLYEKPLHLSA